MCIGYRFALQELQIVLIRWVTRVVAAGWHVCVCASVSLLLQALGYPAAGLSESVGVPRSHGAGSPLPTLQDLSALHLPPGGRAGAAAAAAGWPHAQPQGWPLGDSPPASGRGHSSVWHHPAALCANGRYSCCIARNRSLAGSAEARTPMPVLLVSSLSCILYSTLFANLPPVRFRPVLPQCGFATILQHPSRPEQHQQRHRITMAPAGTTAGGTAEGSVQRQAACATPISPSGLLD